MNSNSFMEGSENISVESHKVSIYPLKAMRPPPLLRSTLAGQPFAICEAQAWLSSETL
jgi:hypothetical protein